LSSRSYANEKVDKDEVFEIKTMKKPNFELINASKKGDFETTKFLYNQENIPLLIASSTGNKELVEFMIKNGADVNLKGGNALTFAYRK